MSTPKSVAWTNNGRETMERERSIRYPVTLYFSYAISLRALQGIPHPSLPHRNALIFRHKLFPMTVETRPSSRQNFSLLISKEKSRDSKFARFRQLSPTIGQFFALSIAERILREDEKRPSASIAQAQGVRTGDVCVLPITRARHTILGLLLIRRFNEAEARAPRPH